MIASRVRQVRELLGWTQAELAQLAGLDQPTISAIESGSDTGQDRAALIAGATGFPVLWFTRPWNREEFPEGSIRYRKTSKASKKDDRRAVRRLEISSQIVDDLSTGFRTPGVNIKYLGPVTSAIWFGRSNVLVSSSSAYLSNLGLSVGFSTITVFRHGRT
jgi:transcriptional regulator with XRE-family HTH domain